MKDKIQLLLILEKMKIYYLTLTCTILLWKHSSSSIIKQLFDVVLSSRYKIQMAKHYTTEFHDSMSDNDSGIVHDRSSSSTLKMIDSPLSSYTSSPFVSLSNLATTNNIHNWSAALTLCLQIEIDCFLLMTFNYNCWQ